jgi:hypothetical protein
VRFTGETSAPTPAQTGALHPSLDSLVPAGEARLCVIEIEETPRARLALAVRLPEVLPAVGPPDHLDPPQVGILAGRRAAEEQLADLAPRPR